MGAAFPEFHCVLGREGQQGTWPPNRPKIFPMDCASDRPFQRSIGPRIQPFTNLPRHHSASFMACLKVAISWFTVLCQLPLRLSPSDAICLSCLCLVPHRPVGSQPPAPLSPGSWVASLPFLPQASLNNLMASLQFAPCDTLIPWGQDLGILWSLFRPLPRGSCMAPSLASSDPC